MPDQKQPLSPLWIVLYLTLHLLWQQFFATRGGYVILPFSFLTIFVLIGSRRGFHETVEQLFGRWLPTRADLSIGAAFIMATVALRLLAGRCFGISAERREFQAVVDLVAVAPVDEELIFRGLFLGILLVRLPRHPWVAVFWSAAIFLGLHSYAGDDVPAIAGVFSLGLLCGSAYATTRCVPLCIVCHSVYNGLTWWTDSPRIMTLSAVLQGLGFFVFGGAAIAWLLRLYIRKKRCGGTAQQNGAGNRSQPVEPPPSQTPWLAGSGG